MEGRLGSSELRSWQTVARRDLLDVRPWMRVWAEDVLLPDGHVVENFYTLEMRDYAVVVALTPNRDVVVERQYKHGPRKVAINLPAGYLEPDEDPLDAARRELLEETGYSADQWCRLGSFANDGNGGRGGGTFFWLLTLAAPLSRMQMILRRWSWACCL